MAPEEPRLPGTTIYLLRAEVQEFAEALIADAGTLQEYQLRDELDLDGRLYVRPLASRPPEWLRFLEASIGQRIRGVGSRQAAALLLFRSGERIVGVTFGLGRHLLAMNRCVPDFGLRVALNVVDPDKIRSVDGRAIEDIILLTRRQGSRGVAVEGLGLQTSRELLRAITGTPVDTELGTRVSGTASLSIAKSVGVREMADRAPMLIDLYSSERYRERFGYVDRIRPIDDADRIAELDATLIRALGSGDYGGAYLAEPEIVDFQRVAHYRFTGEGREVQHSVLVLADYLALHGVPADAQQLRRHRVQLIGGDTDSAVQQWFVYDTLVFEVIRGAEQYVLSEALGMQSTLATLVRSTTALPASVCRILRCPTASPKSRSATTTHA